MKIALVHLRHAGTGGTEGFLNHLVRHLAEHGHEPVVVCRRHEEPPHPAVRFVVRRSLAIGAGMRHWRFAVAVERHVRRTAYDVVLGLGRTWSQDVLRLGGGCHRTWLETGYGAGRGRAIRAAGRARARHRVALWIEERALRPGVNRRVIANSEMVKRDVMARYGLPAEEVAVVHNGVDLERFHPRRRSGEGRQLRAALGIGPDELVVLFLGHGFARKGLDIALSAFPRLRKERRDAHLVVVGHDSAAGAFATLARRLGAGERVHFLGGRRDPEACYAAADLYVLPTRYDPFANSTLEALAAGLPVLTSDANGGAELIEPGVEGTVLPAAAGAAEWGATLAEWSAPARLTAAAPLARALAEAHSIESKMEQTTALLEEVALEKGAAGTAAVPYDPRRIPRS
ncbi:MAG: glycosyltransferase family 4 protein [Planctomycetota bacterium]